MALGDYNSGNTSTDSNKREFKEQEIYSLYNTSNEDGVDPTALSYSFWNGCLKIAIAPQLPNPTEKRKWDHKNAASTFLNHTAARILYEEANKVIRGESENGGVRIGKKAPSVLLTFSNGKEVGCNGYCLILRSIDADGTVLATYVYEFRREYYYGVTNFEADTAKFAKSNYNAIEVDQFLDMLEQYYIAMTKATAYSVMSEMKYDMSRVNTKLGLIAESLGVEFKGGNNNNSGGGTSYFDRGASSEESTSSSSSSRKSGARQTTIDDLEGAMNPPED